MEKEKIVCLSLLLLLSGCGSNTSDEETVKITIKDMTPPVITILKKKSEITEGDNFKLEDCYKVTDNQTKKPEVTLDKGGFDNIKAGTYTIKITAKDNDKNTSVDKFTVTVKAKPKSEKKDDKSSETDSNTQQINKPTENHSNNTQSNQSASNSSNSNSGTANTASANPQPSYNSPAVQPSQNTQADNSGDDDDWNYEENQQPVTGSETFSFAAYGGSDGAYNACANALKSHKGGGCNINSDNSGYILYWRD